MDLEIIDTVTADSLEIGDIIQECGRLVEITDIVDNGDEIRIDVAEDGDHWDTLEFNPGDWIEIYGCSVEKF